MLFHVTATHTEDNCPAYASESARGDIAAAIEKLEALGKELNVKPHFRVSGAPDHVSFMLLEADDLSVVGRYLMSVPLRQSFRITPVQGQG